MSYTCREFGSRVDVHELDRVPFCSLSTGFKCFHCILLLSCAFGGKASRLSDLLQAEQSHIYICGSSLLCSSPLRRRRRRRKKKNLPPIFFSPKLFKFCPSYANLSLQLSV